MRLRSTILALTFCLASWAASAQPIQGFYLGAGAGGLLPLPIKNSAYAAGIGAGFNIRQNPGYDTQLSVGYAIGNGWRFELEGRYDRAGVSGFSDSTFPAAGAGTVRQMGFMANAMFDLDVGSPYVYPYAGLGVGYQSTHLDGFTMTGVSKPVVFSAGGQMGGFAVQAIAGLSFPIPNMPGLSLTVDYRIMDILGAETFNGQTTFTGAGGGVVAGSTKFHNQFDQTVMFGVRYAFNTPRPAPQAALAPAALPPTAEGVRTWRVAFGSDNALLSDPARGVVRQAAAASSSARTTRIQVAGSGDLAAAERRARIVEAALISDGVPKDVIAIVGGGDIGRASGRRVEIVAE